MYCGWSLPRVRSSMRSASRYRRSARREVAAVLRESRQVVERYRDFFVIPPEPRDADAQALVEQLLALLQLALARAG